MLLLAVNLFECHQFVPKADVGPQSHLDTSRKRDDAARLAEVRILDAQNQNYRPRRNQAAAQSPVDVTILKISHVMFSSDSRSFNKSSRSILRRHRRTHQFSEVMILRDQPAEAASTPFDSSVCHLVIIVALINKLRGQRFNNQLETHR
jgi:hypothetical protein